MHLIKFLFDKLAPQKLNRRPVLSSSENLSSILKKEIDIVFHLCFLSDSILVWCMAREVSFARRKESPRKEKDPLSIKFQDPKTYVFDEALKDVITFGSAALRGKNKKFTNDLILKQSGRLQKKNVKMPYKMLLSVEKKRKKKNIQEREDSRKVGMIIGRSKKVCSIFFCLWRRKSNIIFLLAEKH